jgi:hypothetical protein
MAEKKPWSPCTAAVSMTTSDMALPAIQSIEKWLVPHFEKMLYDNALLAMAYLEGYQVTGKEEISPGLPGRSSPMSCGI